jgi:uncharacterized protein (TIGR04222 family)
MDLLNLPGPMFLLVYAVLTAAVCLSMREWIGSRENQPATRILRVRDPYEIAYLRGGAGELVQVAALSLVRRNLLEPKAVMLEIKERGATDDVSVPIERAILDACRTAAQAAKLQQNTSVQVSAEAYRRGLIEGNLMPTEQMQSERNRVAAIAAAVLIGVALVKILYAVAHGHSNIIFLIAFTAIAMFALYKIASVRRTRAGDQALQHLGTLFARVKRGPRPTSPDQLHEALLLAAVYGDYAVPGMAQLAWRKLFRQPGQQGGGSSCGSDGCGSSGCGGGGGGGCGGCGS